MAGPNIYCLKESSTSKKLSRQQTPQLFWLCALSSLNGKQRQFSLIWREFPRLTPHPALPPACGYRVPLQSAKGLTGVNLWKEAGGPRHYYFYYCITSPWVSANCLPVRFGRSPEFDWLHLYSFIIRFSVHLFTCCFSWSVSKRILECKFKFENICLMPFFLFFLLEQSHLSACILSLSLIYNWKASTRARPASPLNLHTSAFWYVFVKLKNSTDYAMQNFQFLFFVWVEKYYDEKIYSFYNFNELSFCVIKQNVCSNNRWYELAPSNILWLS